VFYLSSPSIALQVVICNMFHSYDYFSLGSFSHIPESFRYFTQRVTSIDNRYDLAGFQKLLHRSQILFIWAVGQSKLNH
jgi:hypothetical protein